MIVPIEYSQFLYYKLYIQFYIQSILILHTDGHYRGERQVVGGAESSDEPAAGVTLAAIPHLRRHGLAATRLSWCGRTHQVLTSHIITMTSVICNGAVEIVIPKREVRCSNPGWGLIKKKQFLNVYDVMYIRTTTCLWRRCFWFPRRKVVGLEARIDDICRTAASWLGWWSAHWLRLKWTGFNTY